MPANIKKSRRSTTKERHDHLTAWKNSGLKMSEYCRENDISISSFSTWNKRQESIKPKEIRDITAKPTTEAVVKPLPIEVFMPNGIKKRLSSMDQLPHVLALLSRGAKCN